MFQPELERDRSLQQQPGLLVFTTPGPTTQHQKKIDDVGIGTWTTYFQLDLIELELAQLQLQFGQIRSLTRQELNIGQPSESIGVQRGGG